MSKKFVDHVLEDYSDCIVQKAVESAPENTRKCLKKFTGNVRKIIRLTYNITEQFSVLDSNAFKGLLAANISTKVFSMK